MAMHRVKPRMLSSTTWSVSMGLNWGPGGNAQVTLRRVGFPAARFVVEGDFHAKIATLALRAAQPRAGLLERDVPAEDIGQRARVDLALVSTPVAADADDVGTRVIGELVDGAGGQWHGGIFYVATALVHPAPLRADAVWNSGPAATLSG